MPPPGAGEIHISPGSKPGDGTQGSANAQQISAHPCQGSVPQEPTATHQGTDTTHQFFLLIIQEICYPELVKRFYWLHEVFTLRTFEACRLLILASLICTLELQFFF